MNTIPHSHTDTRIHTLFSTERSEVEKHRDDETAAWQKHRQMYTTICGLINNKLREIKSNDKKMKWHMNGLSTVIGLKWTFSPSSRLAHRQKKKVKRFTYFVLLFCYFNSCWENKHFKYHYCIYRLYCDEDFVFRVNKQAEVLMKTKIIFLPVLVCFTVFLVFPLNLTHAKK